MALGDDAVEELAAREQLHDEVQHRRRLVHLVQLDAATDGAPRAASGHGRKALRTEAGVNSLRAGRWARARGSGAYTLGCSVFVMMSTSVFSMAILLPVGLAMICEGARSGLSVGGPHV